VPTDGTYTFRTTSDDGVALLIDGTPVLSNWTDHAATNNDVPVALTAGSHTIDVRYYENGGVATARLSWLTPGAAAFVVVPAAALRTA
jgi:MSHA biogenesis protein MshQ